MSRADYAWATTYGSDRIKLSAQFIAAGGTIKSGSILDCFTPDIACGEWCFKWVPGYSPRGAVGIYAMAFSMAGHYQLIRGGKVVALWRGALIVPSLYAVKSIGKKLKADSKPLPLP